MYPSKRYIQAIPHSLNYYSLYISTWTLAAFTINAYPYHIISSLTFVFLHFVSNIKNERHTGKKVVMLYCTKYIMSNEIYLKFHYMISR